MCFHDGGIQEIAVKCAIPAAEAAGWVCPVRLRDSVNWAVVGKFVQFMGVSNRWKHAMKNILEELKRQPFGSALPVESPTAHAHMQWTNGPKNQP